MSIVIINGKVFEEPIVIDMGAANAHKIHRKEIFLPRWLINASNEKLRRLQKKKANRQYSFTNYVIDLLKKDIGYFEDSEEKKEEKNTEEV